MKLPDKTETTSIFLITSIDTYRPPRLGAQSPRNLLLNGGLNRVSFMVEFVGWKISEQVSLFTELQYQVGIQLGLE